MSDRVARWTRDTGRKKSVSVNHSRCNKSWTTKTNKHRFYSTSTERETWVVDPPPPSPSVFTSSFLLNGEGLSLSAAWVIWRDREGGGGGTRWPAAVFALLPQEQPESPRRGTGPPRHWQAYTVTPPLRDKETSTCSRRDAVNTI